MKFPSLFAAAFSLFYSTLLGAEPTPDEITIASYNVQNYVGEDTNPNDAFHTRPKPEKSIAALVQIIKEINPDILGVCEMGQAELFADFQARLKAAGLGYTDAEFVQAADPDRHLALLSRFPIVARNSVTDVSYVLNGKPEKVKRGFLDVTVRVKPDYDLRLVGVHLKSKLAVPQGEALMRRHEAQVLRQYLEKIMTVDPEVNLLAYGDFNDTKNEPPIQEIMGPRGSAMHMADLWTKDNVGDRWTHYWDVADHYSRIDYLFVSPALFREVVPNKSRIYRSENWSEASDHRAISAAIVPVNRKR